MKSFKKIANWLNIQYDFYTSIKFEFEFVAELPNQILKNKILVVTEGNKPDTLVFKCPCGCRSTIFLNLLEDAKPRWKYRITKRGNISISPSVWRRVGCKSHFIVREGRINWV